jgi:hypothetical protein
MNKRIMDFNMSWQSGVSPVVQFMYNDKKDFWGEKYNFCGWDYYQGGVFELLGHRNSIPETTSITKSFDWRSRHGANNPLLYDYYYDGDELGTGWITDVREQGNCGSCWAFSANGAVEAMFNLYSNRHLDLSLSVREYLCCNPPVGDCDPVKGGNNYLALDYLEDPGVPTEKCFNYYDPPLPSCEGKCDPVDTLFKINSYLGISSSNNDNIKTDLIQKGPLSVSLPDLKHQVVLNGFTFRNEKTIWIIKNSWGTPWGNFGFGYIEDYQGIMNDVYAILIPEIIVNNAIQNIDPLPYDKDSDGYCNWGLGPIPLNHPECTNRPQDCDDSNPYLGQFDAHYNCTCLLQFNPEVEDIEYSDVWNTPRPKDHIVNIKTGVTLEITSTIYFGPRTKIIIEPGARLFINGGTLTKACNELWEGIEVVGNPELRQNFADQGVVEIMNSGTIEFAKTAIITGRKDYGIIINGYEGGIILAEDAIFRDNEYDIEMLPYRDKWVVPPIEVPNRSSFIKCHFLTDAMLYEYSIPFNHIKLEGVYGVQITGCDFKNDIGFHNWTVNKLGTGILSYNSTFSLNKSCAVMINPCPEEDIIPCSFQGLNYGIKASNWLSYNYLSVKEVKFIDNAVGIYFSAIKSAEIIRNVFNCVSYFAPEYEDKFLGGIYLEDCTGYKVEENYIYGSVNPRLDCHESIGIYVRNSGADDNEIYNNHIDGQYIAIQAEGINKGDRTGLCLKCNKISANPNVFYNFNDFVVTPDKNRQSLSWGIKDVQGSFEEFPDAPAGNEFIGFTGEGVNNSGVLSNWNFYNDGDHVQYIHHATPSSYRPGDNNYFNDNTFRRWATDIDYDEILSCPSHIQDPLYKDLYDPRHSMEAASFQVDFYQALLDSLVDGGDTYSLNQDILTGFPNEALELRQRLMNESPYLSDTVIKSAIYKENVLPNAMIRDIMVLNPQTAKSEKFTNILKYRTIPMADTMMYEIMQGQNIIGSKEMLESKIRYWKEKKVSAKYDLIRSWLSDTTISDPYDSLITLYQNEKEIESKYELAACYLNKNQIIEAIGSLEQIPTEFQLTQRNEEIYNDYLVYYYILKKMYDSCWNVYELDTTSITELLGIMEHGFPSISGYIRGLLVNGKYIEYIEDVAPAYGYKSSKVPITGSISLKNVKYEPLKLFPNPTTDYIIADFNTVSSVDCGKIVIVDLNGKICKEINLLNHQDQIVINLENLTSGCYIVLLQLDNKLISKKKFTKISE